MIKLQAAGVPAGVAQNIKDLHQDPQLAYREHYWQSPPGLEVYTFEAPSARLSKTPASFQRPGPILGEHNDYVFLDLLGIDSDEYGQLIVQGVIG
jgi:crotonobetainyl-CoA:carnitine CoA-transferase CaiB-like acyl-CoA transferase